jgi:hypothetical protein
MINVPKPTSPKVTETQNQIARIRMRGNASATKLKELRAKKLAGQNNVNDSEARLAMILADEEIPASSDIDAQITTELLNWEATNEAEQLLKPKLAAAQYEAATAVLTAIKPEHDALVKPRIVGPLVEFSKAWVELFGMSRELRDRGTGFRCGVCDLVPQLVDLFGPPTPYGPLATFLQAAVRAGYLQSKDFPREYWA